MELDKTQVAVIGTGSVEYALEKAAAPIDAVIAMLEEAKEDGASHVVIASGNYRGAKWMRLYNGFSWADEE